MTTEAIRATDPQDKAAIGAPAQKPNNPRFSTGPCAKRPGWTPAVLEKGYLGRSHRTPAARAKLAEVIDRSHALLGMPADYRLAIVPGSDTGAVESALWNLLGARGVDVLAWESFGQAWAKDAADQLRLSDLRVLDAPYGELPDLSAVASDRDVVFTWNGTTSGVRVPDGDWIASDREGLTICDATSAAFAMDLPWEKLDVVTWSWQKVLGGEGAHGMMALSPRAVERLENHRPPWPLPKIFRLTKNGKLQEDVFRGATLNTPSMLCVEDILDALAWAEGLGGLPALIARSRANLAAVSTWVGATDWVDFLARDVACRSSTSICLKIVAPWFTALDEPAQRAAVKKMVTLLEDAGAAYDIGAHRDAPPGLRLWGGATVDPLDMSLLLPWLGWAQAVVRSEHVT
ncbi:MAG: phosphoserine transaminase [Pseudomonadota bacterium]